MKNILNELFGHHPLDRRAARAVLDLVSRGECSDAELASFLTVYRMRSITSDELAGFCDALRDLSLPVDLPNENAIDLCGTGGDGKNTFNISTLASFVVAGAGGKVIKHGNYGVSSVSGSSNVLEYSGYVFSTDRDHLQRSLEKASICFLHAPLFHPALKNVATVRRQLGVKTIFNMLGPLINPARPRCRLTGVFSLELARMYQYLAQESPDPFIILHSLDGYDELSLTGPVKIIRNSGEELLQPADLGFPVLDPLSISGGTTVETAAKIFYAVLGNTGTAEQENVVLANAALALQCLGMYPEYTDALAASREALDSGAAMSSFKKLLQTA